jgi:drug/metabolite transporter (DMT)-like permease
MIKSRFLVIWLSTYFIFDIIGAVSCKYWVEQKRTYQEITAFLAYTACTVLWMWGIQYTELAKASCLYPIIAMVSGVMVATIWFGEKLTNYNIVGILLGLIAICLIAWEPAKPGM